MSSSGIESVIKVLNEMIDMGIVDRFAIGGAFAATLHNEPIATVDLDVFFFFKKKQEAAVLSLGEIYDFAKTRGFQFDHEFINIHGWLVQFVESSHNPLWQNAIDSAQILRVDDLDVPVIDPEYLVAMWLFAGRPKDYQKMAMFLDAGIINLDRLKNLLAENGLMVKWEKESWRFSDERN